ncbi:hypothetical protein L3X38_025304 [Prunus dulcis]|uniref:Uncharacterized protein n=1 Tax=Prunus dulcis TaxID=3755 RepID=A0AAD4W290_PRUDU|nr:hypothetical protein L3X38_025304 [Prunus dulcis]
MQKSKLFLTDFLKLLSNDFGHQILRSRIQRIGNRSLGYSEKANHRARFTVTVQSCDLCYFDDAPRVSGTPEPCGARIVAHIEVLSLRPARNVARMDLVSPGPARIAAQIEVLSLRPARNAARLTLWFRDLREWN